MSETRIQTATAAKNSAAATKTAPKNLQGWVSLYKDEIAKALPSAITPERFTRMVVSAISSTPHLAECSYKTFLGAMLNAAVLGVEPNTPLGQAYLIPYRNGRTGTYEAQFQLGYKGLLDLAYRSGEISVVQAHEVCEHDTFEYEFGLEPKLKHIPALGDRGDVTHYYAMFRTKDGGYGYEVMSKDQMISFRNKFSKAAASGRSSPWDTNFDEMAKKTVLKKVLKYAPMKTDFARSISSDEQTMSFDRSTGSEDYEVKPIPAEDYEVVDETTGEVKEAE